MKTRLIAAVAALILASSAHAGHIDATPSLDKLPREMLGTYTSNPGETLNAFLLRVGTALHTYSEQANYEACGVIAVATDDKASAQFAVITHSNHAHIGCATDAHDIPAGMVSSGTTIHSHIMRHKATLNATDWLMRGLPMPTDGPHEIVIAHPEQFSSNDFDEPGYLATDSGVFFQDGKGTERSIGSFSTASSTGAL